MRRKHRLFLSNNITNKKELLHSILEYIDHSNKYSTDAEKWSIEKTNTITRMCGELYARINECSLPELSNWWYYSYNFTNFGIILEMCHCSEISYDSDGVIYKSTADEIFPLIIIPCKMLSVSDYAKRFCVTTSTVLRWIRAGKIRFIKRYRNSWIISELADKPRRKYQPVVYSWPAPVPQLQVLFDFLGDFTWVYIKQNDNEKRSYTIILGSPRADNRKSVTLNRAERERLELMLLSLPEVSAEEISNSVMYVPGKIEDEESNKIYQKLSDLKDAVYTGKHLNYSPVIVTKGPHKGRIGYYDDDETKGCIVYFGDIFLAKYYYIIKPNALSNTIPTPKLLDRLTELKKLLFNADENKYNFRLLLELEYCNRMLTERYIKAVYTEPSDSFSIFISHASEDLGFACALATDLKEAGYNFFLDDWSIELGENIFHRIGEGIDTSSALIPIISRSFIKSVFCLDEWTSYYNKFAKSRPNSIYPVVIDDSDVPVLLSARKYIRVKDGMDYRRYLDLLLKALKKHQE